MLPSGTGTSALYLQKHLPIPVLTCACLGSDAYLLQQFKSLEPHLGQYPKLLKLPKKYHYGKLYPELYTLWQKVCEQTGIEFELMYDPQGWMATLDYLDANPNKSILYIHQGGQLGNPSMQARYAHYFKRREVLG